ncbi:MAG: GDP-mannose 4,6-dehydratase [Candidatus Omnitrophica bacterium]|jgi:nucleoside-diphosphate-sugar epimerase|nr:GDP-mannose 4,6-dehydratase [Candidatus Omnitrophota bacterium]
MTNKKKSIIVTGAAGFVGWKTCEFLLKNNSMVIGVDNLNSYYDTQLKKWRLNQLKHFKGFKFYKSDIENINDIKHIIKMSKPGAVINLAARAGVRYSVENPFIYATTNVIGTLNLLELCRQHNINKFVTASTSSLYAGQKMPFKETLAVNTPISPYAATKKAAEALCYTYHHLFGIDTCILRYFTVYGPAGRPDMSPFKFIEKIRRGLPVEIYGDGRQKRDFTYIDDIADATIKALKIKGYNIFNLGNNKPHTLLKLIALIEHQLGKKAIKKYLKPYKTDMEATWADISKANKILDWIPQTELAKGIEKTVKWHCNNNFVNSITIN